MAMRQTPLTCSGHTRPVVDLAFSGITPYGYFLISACKGESNGLTITFGKYAFYKHVLTVNVDTRSGANTYINSKAIFALNPLCSQLNHDY